MIEGKIARDLSTALAIVSSLGRAGLIFSINEIARANDYPGWLIVSLLVSAGVFLTSTYFARVSVQMLIARFDNRLREWLSGLLLSANVDFLLTQDHGQVYSAMTREVGEVSGASINIIESIEAIILIAFCIPYLFWISWVAGFATLLAISVGIIGYSQFERPARQNVMEVNVAVAEFCDRVNDMLSGWKELRLRQSRRDDLKADTQETLHTIRDSTIKAERYFSASHTMAQSAIILLLCFTVIPTPFSGPADTETMFQVLTVILLSYGPIETVFSALPRLARAEAALVRLQEVEHALMASQTGTPNALPSGDPSTFKKIILDKVVATVRDHRLANADETADTFRLGPINLTFTPGETVFICGGNGAGKSTLLDIITGLRPPDEGALSWDGVEISAENVNAYRNLFSAVFSDYHLFDRTYGFQSDELAMLEQLIKSLGLAGRIRLNDDRFSTLSLSSGQKRRLAFAIALAETRKIIVLDEFAADQDPTYRAYFYDKLIPELAAQGYLIIAITHDDTQFSKCDRLIKLEFGKIVADAAPTARNLANP